MAADTELELERYQSGLVADFFSGSWRLIAEDQISPECTEIPSRDQSSVSGRVLSSRHNGRSHRRDLYQPSADLPRRWPCWSGHLGQFGQEVLVGPDTILNGCLFRFAERDLLKQS